MAYERINWENSPSTATPLNATNLNKMDAGIANLDEGVANLNAKFGGDGILDISKGGTGNSVGYIQTGYKALSVRGSKVTIEGDNNEASANNCHAEGSNNTASRNNAHVEGRYNVASGTSSHAEGESNTASGNYSHAGGEGNVAGYSAQTVVGKYNNNKSDTLFEVGNGASDNDRKNAFEVSGDGISTDDGNTKIRFGNNGLGQYGYYKGSDNNLILFDYTAGTGINITNNVIKNIMPQLGDNASFKNIDSVTQGQLGMFGGNVKYMLMHFDTDAEPYNDEYTLMLTYSGSVAIMKSAVLYDRVMGMPYSNKIYAETTLLCEITNDGTGTEADPIHVDVLGVIDGYVTAGWGRQSALGDRATAEGIGTEASGNYAHAQGYQTTASGNQSTAMGYSTTASADGATAMGNGSTASGANSIAGGYNTTASGAVSTAIGTNTQATQQAQVAAGKYNKTNNDALVMVGNGTAANARKNALEVLLNGDVVAGNEIIDGQGNTLSVLAEALTKTASGNPVVITDCAGGKARSLITEINAIQDLHGYDKPWGGGAYKNKVETPSATAFAACGITLTTASNGETTLNGTSTAGSIDGDTFELPAGTYTISVGTTLPSGIWISLDGVGGAMISPTAKSISFTTAEAIRTFTHIYVNAGVAFNNFKLNWMLESGSTATSFAPYSNICPISGRTEARVDDVGKNLADVELGSYGTNGSKVATSDRVRTKTIMHLKKGTYSISATTKASGQAPVINYAFWASADTSGSNTRLYDSAWLSSPYTLTLTEDKYVSLIFKYSSGNNITLSDLSVQLEHGSQASDYTPYVTPTNVTIQLGQTVYGADINWDTGVASVLSRAYDMGELNYEYLSDNNAFRSTSALPDATTENVFINSISSIYKEHQTGMANMTDGEFRVQGGIIYLKDFRFTSASDLKTALSGQTVVYDRATPSTIQLTPEQLEMLKGYNRVTIDNGSIELGYIAKIA